jgi:hypothetical protein
MVDYFRATGNASNLLIRDTGSSVEYYILCSDPYTFTGGLSWSATGTGGGTVSLSAGFSSRFLGSYSVTSSQNVTLSIGASGTSGIGGPTSFTQYISRSGGGSAPTKPSAPGIAVASGVTSTSVTLTWTASASNGGAAIDQYFPRLSKLNPVASPYTDYPVGPTTFTKTITGLTPGTTYYVVVYSHNSAGFSPKSAQMSFTTYSGDQVWTGTEWKSCQVLTWNGTSWAPAEVNTRKTSSWELTL